MERYAKLIDGNICWDPRTVQYDGQIIGNPTPEILTALGYKPVRETDPPEEREGYTLESGWEEEEDEIVQTWSYVPIPEPSDEDELDFYDAAGIILGGEEL